MKVSVIIPAYNSEKWIVRCIESITSQGYLNLEIIVVNDGSTDKTLEVVEKISKKDNRIVVLDKENSGTYLTRKKGIEQSTGDAIFHVDSDDSLEPRAIEILVDKMLKTEANLVVGDLYQVVAGKRRIIENKLPKNRNKTELVKSLLDNRIKGYLVGKLFKRDLMLNINLDFNFIMYEDLMVNLYIFINRNIVIEKVHFPVYNYLTRPGSTNSTKNKELVETIYETILNTEKLLNQKRLLPQLENEFSTFKCRNWITYARLGGALSKNKKFRKEFYRINFGDYARRNLTLYHKIEMYLYCHSPYIGKLTTRTLKNIQHTFY